MDHITNLLSQLYSPETSEEICQSGSDPVIKQVLDHDTISTNKSSSQSSDDGVLCPATNTNQESIGDDEQSTFTSQEAMLTVGCTSTSLPGSVAHHEGLGSDVIELESPGLENQTLLSQPLKEADEITSNTNAISSEEDISSKNQNDKSLIVTSGLVLYCKLKSW